MPMSSPLQLTPLSFPIAADDDVWVARLQGTPLDHIQWITTLLESPEAFCSADPCRVDRSPIIKHLARLAPKLEFMPLLNRFILNGNLKNKIYNKTIIDKSEVNAEGCLLFDPNEPVTILFQYENIESINIDTQTKAISKIKSTDTLIIQGEYGTNTIRVSCPIISDPPESVYFHLITPIQITLTKTNICYVHYDIDSEGTESIHERIAKVSLYPALVEHLLNNIWEKEKKEIAFGADSPNVISALHHSKEEITGRITDRIRFRIADLEECTSGNRSSLSYEFIYQTKAQPDTLPTAPHVPHLQAKMANSSATTTTSPLISTCIKDVATIDPLQIYRDTSGNEYVWITLESSQMIRWILSGTTPAPPQ